MKNGLNSQFWPHWTRLNLWLELARVWNLRESEGWRRMEEYVWVGELSRWGVEEDRWARSAEWAAEIGKLGQRKGWIGAGEASWVCGGWACADRQWRKREKLKGKMEKKMWGERRLGCTLCSRRLEVYY